MLLSSTTQYASSSLLSEATGAGVKGALFNVEVLFCANTEFWLSSIVISMTVDSSSTAVSAPNLTCWMLINFYSKSAI